jgi:hypothetical protein
MRHQDLSMGRMALLVFVGSWLAVLGSIVYAL